MSPKLLSEWTISVVPTRFPSMPRRNVALLSASGVVAIVGGALMILGGVVNHSLALWILPLLQQEILIRLPSNERSAGELAVNTIAFVVSLGGISVIAGGMSLVLTHRSIGR